MPAVSEFRCAFPARSFAVDGVHYVLFGGSVLGIFAGIYYWFPKITGRLLNKGLGEWHFWTVFIGFNGTFLIMHTLGLEGMPRRIATYANPAWATTNMIITASSFLIAFSVLLFLINVHSWRNGEIAGNDPWRGNTLEWATLSPLRHWQPSGTFVGQTRDPNRAILGGV